MVERVAEPFDLVIIDSPPGTGPEPRAVLMAADVAIVPVGPGGTDAWALAETLDLIEAAQNTRGDGELAARLVLTKIDTRTRMGRTARQDFEADEGVTIPFLRTTIGLRTAYAEALTAGTGPTTWEPKGRAAEEVRALARELSRLRRTS